MMRSSLAGGKFGWRLRGTILVGCLLTGAMGCQSMNESNAMRNADPVPAYQTPTPTVFTGERSVTGFERTDWPTQTIHVATNDLETGATFGTWWIVNDDPTRRAAGLYPTQESALDLGDRPVDTQSEYLELVTEPAHQFLNTLLIPVFLFTKAKPGTVVYGPRHLYTRTAPTANSGVHKISNTSGDGVDE